MFIQSFAERLAHDLMERALPEKGYIGLCREVNHFTGAVIDEPCIGPKTNYYRIPYNRDEAFELVGGRCTEHGVNYKVRNNRDLYFRTCGEKGWKNLQFAFFAQTADQPVAVTFHRVLPAPATFGWGDTILFAKHDLEIEIDL
jgi:hypothetical protein